MAAVLMIAAAILGGASRENPLRLAAVELIALPPLVLASRRIVSTWGRAPASWRRRAPLLVLGLMIAVPLLQTVPLPPALWTALPGQGPRREALALAGLAQPWLPASLSPAETGRMVPALIPPAAMLLITLTLARGQARRLAWLWIALAMVGLALGVAQIAAPAGGPAYPYRTTNLGSLVGLFANRNHEAGFLLALLPLAAALAIPDRIASPVAASTAGNPGYRSANQARDLSSPPGGGAGEAGDGGPPDRSSRRTPLRPFGVPLPQGGRRNHSLTRVPNPGAVSPGMASGAAGVFIVVGVVALGAIHSRAGVILAGPAVLGALAVVGAGVAGAQGRRRALGLAAAAGAGVVAVLLLGLRPILDRFAPPAAGAPEVRLEAWPHVLAAARMVLPLGSGLGSFDRVFRAAEPLTLVGPLYLNHAHNEYLEILLETGVVGVAILALFLLWLAPAAWAAWRRGSGLARAASLSILLLLAQSAVDYPLRTETVAVLFAFCCGLLARPDPAPARG
jgi:hypothetical protein